jgi:hypothetical protein
MVAARFTSERPGCVTITVSVSCDGQTTLCGAYSVVRQQFSLHSVVNISEIRQYYLQFIILAGQRQCLPQRLLAPLPTNHSQQKMRRPAFASDGWPWASYDDATPVYKVVASVGLCRQFSSVAGRTSELAHPPAERKRAPDTTGHAPLVTSLHTSSYKSNYLPQDFIELSRHTLRPITQPPVQWLPGLSTRGRGRSVALNTHLHLRAFMACVNFIVSFSTSLNYEIVLK